MNVMPGESDTIELSDDELRDIAGYAAECARRVLPVFERSLRNLPADPRPRDAIDAAYAFMRRRAAYGRAAADRVGGVPSGAGGRRTRRCRRGTGGEPRGGRRVPPSEGERAPGEAHSGCGGARGSGRGAGVRRPPACHHRDPGVGAPARAHRRHRRTPPIARRASGRRAGGKAPARPRRFSPCVRRSPRLSRW